MPRFIDYSQSFSNAVNSICSHISLTFSSSFLKGGGCLKVSCKMSVLQIHIDLPLLIRVHTPHWAFLSRLIGARLRRVRLYIRAHPALAAIWLLQPALDTTPPGRMYVAGLSPVCRLVPQSCP